MASPTPQTLSRTRSPIEAHPAPNFSDPSFDPVDFLNDTLPPLTLASTTTQSPRAASLAELSSQVQSLLSQVNAQNVRHSTSLNTSADDILRSGSRLAYEVEVLRGETVGLSDTLTEVLHDDIKKFIPEGLEAESSNPGAIETDTNPTDTATTTTTTTTTKRTKDPEYIAKLRTLDQVRGRLEEVVRTFGEAMEWALPPSETSLTSSFISVSGPEAGERKEREEKGQEVAERLRTEVVDLLDSSGGGEAGIEAAAQRVEAIRTLSVVWRGTAEEKARNKFVDGLGKLVDDRRRVLEEQSRKVEKGRADEARARESEGTPAGGGATTTGGGGGGGGGFLWNLQRLRDEIYMD